MANPQKLHFLTAVQDLAARLTEPDLRVVDCRFALLQPGAGRMEYRTGHIPGAVYADLDQDLAAPVSAASGRHPLPEVAIFIQKLERWGKKIDHRVLPGTSPEQIEALVTALHALALRIRELGDTRGCPQSELLIKELLDDVRAWRLAIEAIFRNWSASPAQRPEGDLSERLAGKLASLEQRIAATLELPESAALSDEDYASFYRVLGSYRGLSEALVGYAEQAEGIDWKPWQESRF